MVLSELQKQSVAPDDATEWPLPRRILFRFVFTYLVIYNLPFPLNVATGGFEFYDHLWNTLVAHVGWHLFHRTVDITPNGSGDTTAWWIRTACYLVLALLIAVIWTFADRKRLQYNRLHDWLRLYVRFALAVIMISYGAVKVFPSQFPTPSLDRLLQPFGDASPMGLLWTFMGASPAYGIFAGLVEIVGGLLLTTRHTTLLGALVCVGALTNIVVLNFCYDVPVKLYSVHLLLMAVFLAAPDLMRLMDFFVRGRAVRPLPFRPLFRNRRLDRVVLLLRTVFVAGYIGTSLWYSYRESVDYRKSAPSALHGIWTVDQWNVNGAVQPRLITDTSQWRRIVFDDSEVLAVQNISGTWHYYRLTLNDATRTLDLSRREPKQSFQLIYTQPTPTLLILSGTLERRQVSIRLRQDDTSKFLLVRRGFHWISESPYNR